MTITIAITITIMAITIIIIMIVTVIYIALSNMQSSKLHTLLRYMKYVHKLKLTIVK